MSWNKEQLEFIDEYLDDFQYSIFLVEKEVEIKNILFFFQNGELNSDNFKDIKKDVEKLEDIKTKYITMETPFSELEEIINSKKNKINTIRENVSDTTITKIKEKYERKKEENSYEYLHFDSEKIKISLTEYYKEIEKGLNTQNKIIYYNYLIIGFVSIVLSIYKIYEVFK